MAETTNLVETDIIPEQEITFTYDESNGVYVLMGIGLFNITDITVGKEYTVVWANGEFSCTAFESTFFGYPCVAIGNPVSFGGENDDIPFTILHIVSDDVEVNNVCYVIGLDYSPTKNVHVYQVAETAEETDGVDIVLKDRNGDDVVYEGVKKVSLTDVDGNDVIFSEGELVEGLEIDLNMSSGDQTVEAPKGYLVKKATIKKPETLRPENILQDVDIAGVVGELKVSTPKETTIEPDFSEGDMVVIPEDGTMFSKVTIPTPETLIPENIAEGINIAGILGTLATGGSGGDGGSNVKIASGTVTGAGAYSSGIKVNHNLGVIPDLFFAYISAAATVPSTADSSIMTACIFLSKALKEAAGLSYGILGITPSSSSRKVYHGRFNYTIETMHASGLVQTAATTTTLSFGGQTDYHLSSQTYTWVAIAGIV